MGFLDMFTGIGGMPLGLRRMTSEDFDELERLGPEKVRELYYGRHYSPLQSLEVLDWLNGKTAEELHAQLIEDDAEREALDDARWKAEHVLTKRAVEAAEVSAEAGRAQATYAKWAFGASIVAIAISLLALVVASAQTAAQGMN